MKVVKILIWQICCSGKPCSGFSLVFHKIEENLVIFEIKFSLNPDFSALYSSLNSDAANTLAPILRARRFCSASTFFARNSSRSQELPHERLRRQGNPACLLFISRGSLTRKARLLSKRIKMPTGAACDVNRIEPADALA
jgi:hypothetical protein